MRYLIASLCTLILTFPIKSQSLLLEWVGSESIIGGSSQQLGPTAGVVDKFGNLYVCGYYQGDWDSDPGIGTNMITSMSGGSDYFVQKIDSNGNLIWVVSIGGGSSEQANDLRLDREGNLYIAGTFDSGTDFDPGIGTTMLFPNGSNPDVFVQKLDTNGNLIWIKQFGGTDIEEVESMNVDSLGGVYIVGGFHGVVDFDPGVGTANETANGYDAFVVKLDSTGNFNWVSTFTGASDIHMQEIEIDNNFSSVIVGNFYGTVDFDPGLGVTTMTSSGFSDGFIVKLLPNGNLNWVKPYASSGTVINYCVNIDIDGNIITGGGFGGVVDLDPGIDTMNYTAIDADMFISKLDSSGLLIWSKHIQGTDIESCKSIVTDSNGQIYFNGLYKMITDFDPGIGITSHTSEGNFDSFCGSLDSSGNFLWVGSMGGTSSDYPVDILIDNNGSIYNIGVFSGVADFDPGPGTSIQSASLGLWIAKYNQDPCASIAVVIDSLTPITCSSILGYANGHVAHGNSVYSYNWNTNPIITTPSATFSSPGLYTLSIQDTSGCTASTSIIVDGPLYQTGFDLNANLVGGSFRSGFPVNIWLNAFNNGCLTPIGGQMALVLDPLAIYDSADVSPDFIYGDTLIWNIGSMNYDSLNFMRHLYLTTNSSAIIGDTLCFDLIILPKAGDLDTTNNLKSYCFPVVNGYDPNDKQVYPQGLCSSKIIEKTDIITYTIRFQNTGNAEAVHISIMDTLDSEVDISSIRIVGTSHPQLIPEILYGNVIKFKFDSIMLPDSNSDLSGSNGYVIFELKVLPTTTNGSYLMNDATIYFDYNPGIATNLIWNLISNSFPCIPVNNQDNIFSYENVSLVPNPTTEYLKLFTEKEIYGLYISDISGRIIEFPLNNSKRINVSHLPRGLYFIHLETNDGIITQKFVKQ